MFEDDPTVAEQIQESKKNLDQAESEAEAKRKQESLEWVKFVEALERKTYNTQVNTEFKKLASFG